MNNATSDADVFCSQQGRFIRSHRRNAGSNRGFLGRVMVGFLIGLSVAASSAAQPKKGQHDQPAKKGEDRKSVGRELFRSGKDGKAGQSAAGWCIVLEVHSGPKAKEAAHSRLAVVSSISGRQDVYVRETERGAAVVAGVYGSPEDAANDLKAIRSRRVDDQTPFASSFLAPPIAEVDPGKLPELNLESAKLTFGVRAQYTLQIAVYESAKRDEAKRAAEQAALKLRREGELAFYYHGPQRSMVTLGVFSDRDFDQNLRPRNASLIAAQERFPLNLLNGQYPIIEKSPGQPDREQPSTLVRIP